MEEAEESPSHKNALTGSVPPSEGERHAAVGYEGQYRVGAGLILNGLRRDLRYIRVVDPLAGRVDDLQIGSSARLDAYQVKWRTYPGTMNFSELISASSGSSLIQQLAEGWSVLRASRPGTTVVVHLVTNDNPNGTQVLANAGQDTPGEPRHFAAFIEEVWKPAHRSNEGYAVPERWLGVWAQLREASGLSIEDFGSFVRHCELDFGTKDGGDSGAPDDEGRQLAQDINDIGALLFQLSASRERIVELSSDQLLQQLGWQGRMQFVSQHSFPIESALYRPIEVTREALNRALDELTSGYICLLGSPGSGKSSLLTDTLARRPERVALYYCYVPKSADLSFLRGEAGSFLHDVVVQLERMGVRGGRTLPSPSKDVPALAKRFMEQLTLLNERWLEDGIKTLILVDGLDHIGREQSPGQSLLSALPESAQIPEGVLIVLGSQTDQLAGMATAVQSSLQGSRRIEMSPLPRDAVFSILDSAGLADRLTNDQQEQVAELSAGHPLALAYLVNLMTATTGAEELAQAIADAPRFEDAIDSQYMTHWRALEEDTELTDLLALIARLRRSPEGAWLLTWNQYQVLDRLRRAVGHLFDRSDTGRLSFFHESFRLFVQRVTKGELAPEQLDLQFHARLADTCANSADDVWKWEEIYHASMAHDQSRVVGLATQDLFRSQSIALRPFEEIEDDLKLAMRAAGAIRDVVALSRLLLAASEQGQRQFNLQDTALLKLLSQVDDPLLVLCDGNRLRAPRVLALEISGELANDNVTQGRRLFDLAQPLSLLSGRDPVDSMRRGDDDDVLEAWADASVHYLAYPDFRASIGGVRVADKYRQASSEQDEAKDARQAEALRVRLAVTRCHSQVECAHWSEFEAELPFVEEKSKSNWFWLLYSAVGQARALGDGDRSGKYLEILRERVNVERLTDDAKIALGELLFLGGEDAASVRAVIEGITEPTLVTDFLRSESGLGPFSKRFRHARLSYALGSTASPEEMVPEDSNEKLRGVMLFERALCRIAKAWALGWRGEPIEDLSALAADTLRIFYQNPRVTRDWMSWLELSSKRSDIHSLLVKAVKLQGTAALRELRGQFEGAWNNEESSRYWPVTRRREVVQTFHEHLTDVPWAFAVLNGLQAEISNEGGDASTRVEEYQSQAEAWITLGERDRARECLITSIDEAFSVPYRKDDQLERWMRWLGLAAGVNTVDVSDDVSWLSRCVAGAKEIAEGDVYWRAAEALLKAVASWRPAQGAREYDYLSVQGVLTYQAGVTALVDSYFASNHWNTQIAAAFISNLAFPIFRTAQPTWLRLLIERAASDGGDEAAQVLARALATRLAIYPLRSTRGHWGLGIRQGLEAIGVDPNEVATEPIVESAETDTYVSRVTLPDGTSKTPGELAAGIVDLTDLVGALKEERGDSHFDWSGILAEVGDLGSGQVSEVIALLKDKQRGAIALATLSRRLRGMGMLTEARVAAEEAVNSSQASGWDVFWDRGSRIIALGALLEIDEAAGRTRAWELLCGDLSTSYWYPQAIARSLPEIAALLVPEVPIAAIWEEIRKYLTAMFKHVVIPEDGPDLTAPESNRLEASLLDFVRLYLDHPVEAIRIAAKRALAEILPRSGYLQETWDEWLSPGSDLAVAEVLAGTASEIALEPFREKLIDLSESRDCGLRMMAIEACGRLGVTARLMTDVASPLPAIYDLSLPALPDAERLDTSPPGASLPDSNNPREFASAWGVWCRAVSDMAGVPLDNFMRRVYQLMAEVDPRQGWTSSAEDELRRQLDSQGLELPYRRPRAAISRRAVLRALAELLDARQIPDERIEIILQVVRLVDLALLFTEPSARPREVASSRGGERFSRRDSAWLDAVSDTGPDTLRSFGGFRVLAERTTLQRLNWGRPTETRLSVVRRRQDDIDPQEFFELVRNRVVADYRQSDGAASDGPLITKNFAYGFDSPADDWLAINPDIARRLGWQLDTEGLFRWLNGAGEIMVETLWWMDGLLGLQPYDDDEVGEGWLVTASEEAWRQLTEAWNTDPIRTITVLRSYSDEAGYELESRSTIEEPA